MFSVEKVARVTGVTKATVLRAAKGYKLAYTTMEGQLFSTAEDVAVWRMGTVQQTYIDGVGYDGRAEV